MTATEEQIAAAADLRRQWKANDDRRDKDLTADRPGVRRFADIAYGPAGSPWNLLDVSVPEKFLVDGADGDTSAPVIISIHGGGWFYGTKQTYRFWAAHMASLGFAVVNFTYRLPPHCEFPGELDDVSRAVSWVDAHAEDYHLDRRNVFLIGDSAGGQMLLQYLTAITNPAFNAHFGYPVPDLTIRAVVSNCGATFMENLPAELASEPYASSPIGLAQRSYFTPESLAENPERLWTEKYVTTALPPLLLVTGNADFLHDDSVRLDGFLLAKGIAHEFRSYGTPDNPQPHVFCYDMKNPIGLRACADEAAFLRDHIVGR